MVPLRSAIVALGVASAVGLVNPVARAGERKESAEARQVTIHINGETYYPKELELRAGDSVVWINDDTVPHTATSDKESDIPFDTGRLKKGEASEPVVFREEGEVPYHCEIHGKKLMSAKIMVKAASKPGLGPAEPASEPRR